MDLEFQIVLEPKDPQTDAAALKAMAREMQQQIRSEHRWRDVGLLMRRQPSAYAKLRTHLDERDQILFCCILDSDDLVQGGTLKTGFLHMLSQDWPQLQVVSEGQKLVDEAVSEPWVNDDHEGPAGS